MKTTSFDNDNRPEGEVLLIDKPVDYTSAHVVNIVKKAFDVKKAGHSGTLDPKASGLLIICTGKKTKMLSEMLITDKEYEGIIELGSVTKSFDSETEVHERKPFSHVTMNDLESASKKFTGEIEQVPPMYSAIKYKGKPLYKYARKNKEIERKPRKIFISRFEITKMNLPDVYFRIRCSKGTYIRSIANDFGETLGTGGYLKELRRTKIGDYDVVNALKLDEIISKIKNND